MKKYTLILLLILPTLLFSQRSKSKLWDNWNLNINGGQTWFLGDVSKNFKQFEPSLRETSAAAGLILSKDLGCVVGLRGQVFYGNLFGQKDFFDGGGVANLGFKAQFWNYNINATINLTALLGKCNTERKFDFYGILGIGFTDFKTRLYNSVTGAEIATWGYSRPSEGTYYWVTETTGLAGMGMSYRFGKKIKITLESIINEVNSDKVDHVMGMTNHDGYYYTSLGITYNLSKKNRACECRKSSKRDRVENDIIEKVKQDTALVQENTQVNQLQKEIDSLNNAINNKVVTPDTATAIKEFNFDNIVNKIFADVKDTIENTGFLLHSVYFDVNKWDIKTSEKEKVEAVANILTKNPTLMISIVGHADRQGGYNYNIWLSKQRAEAVANMLVNEYKISPSRYKIDWRGYNEPLSQKYYYINRRVDFLKIGK